MIAKYVIDFLFEANDINSTIPLEIKNIIRQSDKIIATTKDYIFIYDTFINDDDSYLSNIVEYIIEYLERLTEENKIIDELTKSFIKNLIKEEYTEDIEGFFEIIENNLIFFLQDTTISLNKIELIKSTIGGCA